MSFSQKIVSSRRFFLFVVGVLGFSAFMDAYIWFVGGAVVPSWVVSGLTIVILVLFLVINSVILD